MNTFIKRVVCGFLAFLVLLVSVIIPDFSSFADGVPAQTNMTVGDLLNGYTSRDLLSVDNYDNYYDTVTGTLKEQVYDTIYMYDGNADFGNSIATDLCNQVENSTSPLNTCYFYNGVQGKKVLFLGWWRSDYMPHLYCCTIVPTVDDIIIVQGHIISSGSFDIYAEYFAVNNSGSTITHDNVSDSDKILHSVYNSQFNWYEIDYSNGNNMWMYSDYPFYMTLNWYSGETPDLYDYTQAPYYYSSYYGIANAVWAQSDDSGFVVDRRLSKMTGGGGTSVDPQNYGFQQGSFAAQVYGSTFNDQKLFVAYQLNEPSTTIQNDLYLRLDYQFDFDGGFDNYMLDYSNSYHNILNYYDMYSLADTNYINIDLDNVFSKMLDVDATLVRQYNSIKKYLAPTSFTPGSTGAIKLGVSPLDCFNILRDNNILTEAPVARNYQNEPLIESLAGSYKDFNFSVGINTNAIYTTSGIPLISRLDSCLLTVTMSIYNVSTGENGSVFLYSYDYKNKSAVTSGSLENNGTFGGSYSNGAQSGLNNPNSSELGYNISNGVSYPVSSGSSSSGNTVVVNPSPYPYVLVDIPENEWMNYTPNLKSLLETYKDALSTTKDDSILPLIAQTYNYIPAGAMQYLIYGVGIIVMIGIWRAITRR